MRPPRPAGAAPGHAVRGGVQKRVVAPSAGGRNPQARGGRFLPGHGCDDIDPTGTHNWSELQGRDPAREGYCGASHQSTCGLPRPATYVGDASDPQAPMVFSCPDDTSEALEDDADMFCSGSMAANGYYSNLMTEGTDPFELEDFSSPYAEQQSQEVEVTPSQRVLVTAPASSARPNHKRSKNFNEKEDEILVSAWLNVSLDPITGANQTHKSYWTRIHDYFHENLPFPSDRTQNSLMHRWSTIQDSVNKFTGCLSRITGRRQSGATMQDKIEDAKAMYKSEDGQNRSFQFMDCWKQLRGQAKWMAKLDELAGKSSNKKQKKTSTSSLPTPSLTTADGHEVATPEENTLSRPKGHKKAKAALYKGGKKSCTEGLENLWAKKKEFDSDKELKKDERFKQAFAPEQERVANEKLNLELRKKELELRAQEVELKNKKEEERIMTMDLSALPMIRSSTTCLAGLSIMSRRLST